MKNIYRKIKEIRELKGYKQKELAEYLGLEQSSYNKIENGKTALTIENLQKIADFLGVGIQEILFSGQDSQDTSEKDRKIRRLEKEIELLEKELWLYEREFNVLYKELSTIVPKIYLTDILIHLTPEEYKSIIKDDGIPDFVKGVRILKDEDRADVAFSSTLIKIVEEINQLIEKTKEKLEE